MTNLKLIRLTRTQSSDIFFPFVRRSAQHNPTRVPPAHPTPKMISPATASAAMYIGNGITCIALPRKQLGEVYLNGTQLPVNDEAQAGWKFMGITALQLGATLLVADKVLTGDDKKKMNMGIAAGGAAAAGMFAVNGFCTDMVKPEMRIMNAIGNAAVAGLAIKALMEK